MTTDDSLVDPDVVDETPIELRIYRLFCQMPFLAMAGFHGAPAPAAPGGRRPAPGAPGTRPDTHHRPAIAPHVPF